MAFFKVGKKKNEEPLDIMQTPEIHSEAASLPVEQALMMKQQGYTNNQIAQILQGQGYNNSQISDVINQASLSGGFQESPSPELETGMPDYGQSYEQEQPYTQTQFQAQRPQAAKETDIPPSIDEERMQEIAEAIIDEKWEEFAKDVNKMIEWKERNEDRISKVEQQLIDLRLSIDSLTKSIMVKVSSYDQNIVDVGTEIKAMEKVFQKVLPTLTENVNKLDRMTKGYKVEQQVKK